MNVRRQKQAVLVLNMTLPLFLGGCLYLMFRPDSFICHEMWELFHIRVAVSQSVFMKYPILCTFLKNYAGDILWAYAFFVTVAWAGKDVSVVKLLECVVFEAFFESMQYFRIIAGTYDICDILAETAATLVAYCLLKKGKICVNTRRNKERNENEEQMDT